MKQKHILKKKTFFQILIVPHSNAVKKIKVPSWLPLAFSILFLLLISSGSFYTWHLYRSYNYMKTDYHAKVQEVKRLRETSRLQQDQLDSLDAKTSQIENKLSSILDLQDTVRDMVGLKPTASSGTTTTRSKLALTPGIEAAHDKSNLISQYMDDLSLLLDQSKIEFDELITDVEKKLTYLEAKPNIMPTKGRITSGFGYRKNPFGNGKEFHYGLDIANDRGTPIKAAGKGVVTFSGYNGGYGKVIIISHGYGYQSIYGHNDKLLAKVGQTVEKGELIAKMGNTGRSTGPHVHFEIRYYNKPTDPMDVVKTRN